MNSPHAVHLLNTLLTLSLVFIMRHWLIAILNGSVTLCLGLGLVRIASRWGRPPFSATELLRIRHVVVLAALAKGAFYLLQGTSVHTFRRAPVAVGLQFPDPVELLGLTPMTSASIWNPTADTHLVSLLLGIAAAVAFLFRARQMFLSQKFVETYVRLSGYSAQEALNVLLRQAAADVGLKADIPLPQVVVADIACPTPLLLGVWHPCILLTPNVLAALTSGELGLVFRHELAHFRRRDHWWRWGITWIEDIGRLSLLSAWLGMRSQLLEEELCDRMAVQSADDATLLASAITKSILASAKPVAVDAPPSQLSPITHEAGPSGNTSSVPKVQLVPHVSEREAEGSLTIPHSVVPFLQGRHTQKWLRSPLSERLAALLSLAQELSPQNLATQNSAMQNLATQSVAIDECNAKIDECAAVVHPRDAQMPSRFRQRLSAVFKWAFRLLFGIVLFLILYAKFQLLIGPL